MNFEFDMATEKETLAFCNAVREAGGGELITELVPGYPGVAKACLIAQSLNFDCMVTKYEGIYWAMFAPKNVAKRIAKKLHLVWESTPSGNAVVILPEPIARVAEAFDARTGWPTKYALVD